MSAYEVVTGVFVISTCVAAGAINLYVYSRDHFAANLYSGAFGFMAAGFALNTLVMQ